MHSFRDMDFQTYDSPRGVDNQVITSLKTNIGASFLLVLYYGNFQQSKNFSIIWL